MSSKGKDTVSRSPQSPLQNTWHARIVFAQGWQGYDLDRMGNGGILYTSSFNGWTSEANIELGKRFGADGWSLRPVVAADVFTAPLVGTKLGIHC